LEDESLTSSTEKQISGIEKQSHSSGERGIILPEIDYYLDEWDCFDRVNSEQEFPIPEIYFSVEEVSDSSSKIDTDDDRKLPTNPNGALPTVRVSYPSGKMSGRLASYA
jgi:hypothetical protein